MYDRVRNATFHQPLCREYNLILIYGIQGKEEMAVLPFTARNSNLEDLRPAGTADAGEISTYVLSRILNRSPASPNVSAVLTGSTAGDPGGMVEMAQTRSFMYQLGRLYAKCKTPNYDLHLPKNRNWSG